MWIKKYGEIGKYSIALYKRNEDRYYICSVGDNGKVDELSVAKSIEDADDWWTENQNEDYNSLLIKSLGL